MDDCDEYVINTYKNVRSIDDLKQINIDFLNGKNKCTYFCFGSVHKDHNDSIPQLIMLNNLGFITTDGQSPVDKVDVQQKSYVSGYFPKVKIEKLQNQLLKENDVLFSYIDYDNNLIFSNFPEMYYNLTKCLDKETKDWKECTWHNINDEYDQFTRTDMIELENVENVLKEFVELTVVSTCYGGNRVESKLIEFLLGA